MLNLIVQYTNESIANEGISPDGWLSLLGTIISSILAAYIAYIVAKQQVKAQTDQVKYQMDEQARQARYQIDEQVKKEDKRERKIIVLKLKLDTYIQLEFLIREYHRETSQLIGDLALYDGKTISKKEYRRRYLIATEDTILRLKRSIQSNLIFLPEFTEEYNNIRTWYDIYAWELYCVTFGKKEDLKESILDGISIDIEAEENTEFIEHLNGLQKLFIENPMNQINEAYKAHDEVVIELMTNIASKMQDLVDEIYSGE